MISGSKLEVFPVKRLMGYAMIYIPVMVLCGMAVINGYGKAILAMTVLIVIVNIWFELANKLIVKKNKCDCFLCCSNEEAKRRLDNFEKALGGNK